MQCLRLVASLKLQVSFAEYRLLYRALLQKRPIILRSLLIVAPPHRWNITIFIHLPQCVFACVCVCACVCMYVCVCVIQCHGEHLRRRLIIAFDAQVCVCAYVSVHLCVCVFVNMCVCLCVCVCVCVCACMSYPLPPTYTSHPCCKVARMTTYTTHYHTLQHAATHYDMLQHAATHSSYISYPPCQQPT